MSSEHQDVGERNSYPRFPLLYAALKPVHTPTGFQPRLTCPPCLSLTIPGNRTSHSYDGKG